MKLMLRLYEPSEGRVLLDGLDIREYELMQVRKIFGVVFQDFSRYAFTVRENIALSNLDHIRDDTRLQEACKKSGADDVVSALDEGLDTFLTRGFEKDGAELSGGQWQKIALARAFFRDSDMLVLDEPTSDLDPEAEHALFERFATLCHGKEALLISHRLSSVTMVDRILVLEAGKILESGSHAELLHAGGRYAELFNLQAERYMPPQKPER